METIIFAGISLFILIPVLYVLPLGIGTKGKLVLAGASAAAALAGLAASLAYPFWQAVLISLLLVAVFTYLLDKNAGRFTNQPEAAAAGYPQQAENRLKPAAPYIQETEEEYTLEQIPAAAQQEPPVQEEEPLSAEEQPSLPAEPAGLSEEEYRFFQSEGAVEAERSEMDDSSEDAYLEELLEGTFDIKSEEEKSNEIGENVPGEIPIEESHVIEDVREEADAKELESSGSMAEPEEFPAQIAGPASDAENSDAGMIEPEYGLEEELLSVFDEEGDLLEELDPADVPDLLEDISEDGPPELEPILPEAGYLNDMDLEVEAVSEDAEEKPASWADTLQPLEDWDMEEPEVRKDSDGPELVFPDEAADIYAESAEAQETVEAEMNGLGEGFEIIEPLDEGFGHEPEMDTAGGLRLFDPEPFDIINNLPAEPAAMDQPLKPERLDQLLPEGTAAAALEQLEMIDPIIPGENAVHPEPEKPDTVWIRQEVFNTVLAELQAAKQQRSGAEFERFAAGCLTDQLPDQPYYTVASLLADHYIETGQTMKLHALLAGLEEKFQQYPVILSEIHFIYDRYCTDLR